MEFVSIDRIFSMVERDLPTIKVNDSDIVEWTGDALEFINAIRAKEEAVAFIKVSNYQCDIPANLHNIIQIARNIKIDNPNTKVIKSESDVTINPLEDSGPNHPVCIDCNGQPYDETTVAYYRPYYDMKYEYEAWTHLESYNTCYVPVRLSNHHFFNTLVCSENGTDCGSSGGLYHTEKLEYNIIMGKVLRFNFEKGLIAIAYERNPHDTEGLPLIPDHISYTTAIISYITLKYAKREFMGGITGAKGRLDHAQKDWTWYVKQASNSSLIPNGVDEMENLVNQQRRLIPRRNLYNNYFGNSNNRETKNILNKRRKHV